MISQNTDIIYGKNPILEAIENGILLDKILIQNDMRGETEKEIRHLAKKNGINLTYVPKEKLSKIAPSAHQGLVAYISKIVYANLQNILENSKAEGKIPTLVILDGITDVRNMGAIARSAEIFNIDALIVLEKNSAQINEEAIKASAGALLSIPVCREKSLAVLLETLINEGFQVWAADLNTEKKLGDIPTNEPIALVLGAEGSGISKVTKDYADGIFSIDQGGKIQSLNVSVAAGIIFHHIFAQKFNIK